MFFLVTFVGSKKDMDRLDQLFIEGKFNPLDVQLPPLNELLATLLTKAIPKEKKKKKSKGVDFYVIKHAFYI